MDDESGVGREGGSEGFVHRFDLPKLLKFRFFVPGVIKVICEHIVATTVFYQIYCKGAFLELINVSFTTTFLDF